MKTILGFVVHAWQGQLLEFTADQFGHVLLELIFRRSGWPQKHPESCPSNIHRHQN